MALHKQRAEYFWEERRDIRAEKAQGIIAWELRAGIEIGDELNWDCGPKANMAMVSSVSHCNPKGQ
jgi:hypothetical protein